MTIEQISKIKHHHPTKRKLVTYGGSDQEQSETSEKLLAQMREAFRKKEIGFKNRIKSLTKSISSANDNCREKLRNT